MMVGGAPILSERLPYATDGVGSAHTPTINATNMKQPLAIPAHATVQSSNPSTNLTIRRLESVQNSSQQRLQELQTQLQTLKTKQKQAQDEMLSCQDGLVTLQNQRSSILEPTRQQIQSRHAAWQKHEDDCHQDVKECKLQLDYVKYEYDSIQRELFHDQSQQSLVASYNDDVGGSSLWSSWMLFCTYNNRSQSDQDGIEAMLESSRDWEIRLQDLQEEHRQLQERHAKVSQTIQFWASQDRQQAHTIQTVQDQETHLEQRIRELQDQVIPSLIVECQICQSNVDTIQKAFQKCAALHTQYKQTQALENAENAQSQMRELENQLKQAKEDASWWQDTNESLEERMEQLELSKQQTEATVLNQQCQIFDLNKQVQTLQDQVGMAQFSVDNLQSQLETMKAQKAVLRDLLKERVERRESSHQQQELQQELQSQVQTLTNQLVESQKRVQSLMDAKQRLELQQKEKPSIKQNTLDVNAIDGSSVKSIFRSFPGPIDVSTLTVNTVGDGAHANEQESDTVKAGNATQQTSTIDHVASRQVSAESVGSVPIPPTTEASNMAATESKLPSPSTTPEILGAANRVPSFGGSAASSIASSNSSDASSVVSTTSSKSTKVVALRQRMKDLEGKKNAITSRLQQHKQADEGEHQRSSIAAQTLQAQLLDTQTKLSNERLHHAASQQKIQLLEESSGSLESRCQTFEKQAVQARNDLQKARLVLQRYLAVDSLPAGKQNVIMLQNLLAQLSDHRDDDDQDAATGARNEDEIRHLEQDNSADASDGLNPQSKGLLSTES